MNAMVTRTITGLALAAQVAYLTAAAVVIVAATVVEFAVRKA